MDRRGREHVWDPRLHGEEGRTVRPLRFARFVPQHGEVEPRDGGGSTPNRCGGKDEKIPSRIRRGSQRKDGGSWRMGDETTSGSEGSGASVRRGTREDTIASIASVRQEEMGQEGRTMERSMRRGTHASTFISTAPSVERTSDDTSRDTPGRKIPPSHPISDRDAPLLRSTTDVDPHLPWLRPLRSKVPSHPRPRSLPDCDPT